jgi:peptide deformylase
METKNKYDRILLWDKSLVGMPCQKTSGSEVQDLDLRARLLRTCIKYGGVGVAAPQIGLELQAALINFETTTRLLVNPEIVETGKESSEYFEGCLSLPLCSAGRAHNKSYQGGKVSRADKITVKYLSDEGEERVEEFNDFTAHIVAHELDHLSGRFYVEHLKPLEQQMVMRKYQRFRKRFVVA